MTAPETAQADYVADLDLAATYARTMSKAAQRAHDVRRYGPIIAHRMGDGSKAPPAEQSEADFLADFDRLAVIAERVRAAVQPVKRAA